MTTKKAAAHERKLRGEGYGADGPRRYTLRATMYEISEAYGPSAPWDEAAAYPLEGPFPAPARRRAAYPQGNRAQPERTPPEYIPQAKPAPKENPFKKRTAPGHAKSSKHKVGLPPEFVEWAERQGFSPAAAARFVLAWFCEREKIDKSSKVQYTSVNRPWQTSGPKTKKTSP